MNVTREALAEALRTIRRQDGDWAYLTPESLADLLLAALASATPSAWCGNTEPHEPHADGSEEDVFRLHCPGRRRGHWVEWPDLANDIRLVDGNHDLGERGWTKAPRSDPEYHEHVAGDEHSHPFNGPHSHGGVSALRSPRPDHDPDGCAYVDGKAALDRLRALAAKSERES